MKTTISTNNPFGFDRLNWAYGFEFIKQGDVVLDYGCFNGEFIKTLGNSSDVVVFGADKSRDIVELSNQNNIFHITKELPFVDKYFDAVTMFEVLEHVHDQRFVTREIRRVLKDGGLLILSVPQKHIFSFLDWGNLKYVFPKIHKYWYVRKHSEADYLYRYVNNPSGLIGDVDKEKAWHQHFEISELSELLNSSGFTIKNIDGYGAFGILLTVLGLVFRVKFPAWLVRWQMMKFQNEKILCVAEKIAE
jgi:SAM-dependent methyltransferase